jgi:DNA polymerase-3 subunit epsilon
VSVDDYAVLADRVVNAWNDDVSDLIGPLRQRLAGLSAHQRYEEAALVRDRIATLIRSCARMQSVTAFTRIAELVAARPDGAGGWELSVIRHGRLVGADAARRGVPPAPLVDMLIDSAEAVAPAPRPAMIATLDETELILRWLAEPGVRLVRSTEPWTCPRAGAARLRSWLSTAEAAPRSANPFVDRRRLPISHRPSRQLPMRE